MINKPFMYQQYKQLIIKRKNINYFFQNKSDIPKFGKPILVLILVLKGELIIQFIRI